MLNHNVTVQVALLFGPVVAEVAGEHAGFAAFVSDVSQQSAFPSVGFTAGGTIERHKTTIWKKQKRCVIMTYTLLKQKWTKINYNQLYRL